eukprot:5228604-Prymnesium_polylepis.1
MRRGGRSLSCVPPRWRRRRHRSPRGLAESRLAGPAVGSSRGPRTWRPPCARHQAIHRPRASPRLAHTFAPLRGFARAAVPTEDPTSPVTTSRPVCRRRGTRRIAARRAVPPAQCAIRATSGTLGGRRGAPPRSRGRWSAER